METEPSETEPPDIEPTEATPDAADWLVYELHEWALESRVMLEQLLTADQVVHSWQGTDLMVHHTLEAKVDELMTEVEEATQTTFNPDDDLISFDLSDWTPDRRLELRTALENAAIPCQLTDSDTPAEMYVRQSDEERAELVLDDVVARFEESHLTELDGLEVNRLLSELFVACDRLHKSVADPHGVVGVLTCARKLAAVRTPFGFSPSGWKALRTEAAQLVALLESEATDESTDDAVTELATSLRNNLHPLV